MMHLLKIALSGSLLLLVLGGCLHRGVEYQVLEKGMQAGGTLSKTGFAVLEAEEDFAEIYREIHSGELPPPKPPAVDFSEWFVLLVAMGEKPTAGYAVEVGRVVHEESRLKVEVRFIEPPPQRMQAAVITRPYALIRIERQPGIETVVMVDPGGKRLAEVPLGE